MGLHEKAKREAEETELHMAKLLAALGEEPLKADSSLKPAVFGTGLRRKDVVELKKRLEALSWANIVAGKSKRRCVTVVDRVLGFVLLANGR